MLAHTTVNLKEQIRESHICENEFILKIAIVEWHWHSTIHYNPRSKELLITIVFLT